MQLKCYPHLPDPKNLDVVLDAGEVCVAGGYGGVATGGESGGEAVGIGEIVAGVEFGGEFGEDVGGGDQIDGELRNFGDDILCGGFALGAPDGVVDLAPVHHTHEEFAGAAGGAFEHLLHLVGAGPIEKKRNYGAGVEHDGLRRDG